VRKVKLFAIALLSVTALAQERGVTCTILRQSDEYYSAVCKNTLHNPPVYTRHETDTDESSVKQIDRTEYNRLINRLAAETQDDQRNNAYRAACTKKVWEKVNDMPTQEFTIATIACTDLKEGQKIPSALVGILDELQQIPLVKIPPASK
jgi:hypothetical protein